MDEPGTGPIAPDASITVNIPFGDLLRAVRSRNGLSLDAASRRLGVSKTVLSRYESGTRLPAIEMRSGLVEALGGTEAEVQAAVVPYQFREAPSEVDLRLRSEIEVGAQSLDLIFFALDAYWATQGKEFVLQRINTIGAYVQWLGWWYRDREANLWASRFLDIAARYSETFGYARLVRARLGHLVEVERREIDGRAWVESILHSAKDQPNAGFLWREYASILEYCGEFSSARAAISRARDLPSVGESRETVSLCCDLIEGSLLAKGGEPVRALDRAFRTLPEDGFLRFATAGVRAKLLVAVGDRNTAATELGLLAEEALSHNYGHFAEGLLRRRRQIIG